MIRNALNTLACVVALYAVAPPAQALTADNVNCNKCVGNEDLANKAATGKKIKKGAATNKKIKKNTIQSSRVKDKSVQNQDLSDTLIEELGAGFLTVVDKDGKVVGPLHPGGSRVVLHFDGRGTEYGLLRIGRNGIYTVGTIYYSAPGCKGAPYTDFTSIATVNNVQIPVNNALKSLGVGFDPTTGELAALVAKNPLAEKEPTDVESHVSPVTDGVGNIAYLCDDGSSKQDVVDAQVVRHIEIIDNPPFRIHSAQ